MPRTRDLRRDYAAAIERHGYCADDAQRHAVAKLDDLARRLRSAEARERGVLARVLGGSRRAVTGGELSREPGLPGALRTDQDDAGGPHPAALIEARHSR